MSEANLTLEFEDFGSDLESSNSSVKLALKITSRLHIISRLLCWMSERGFPLSMPIMATGHYIDYPN
jgi:hypothetical protein